MDPAATKFVTDLIGLYGVPLLLLGIAIRWMHTDGWPYVKQQIERIQNAVVQERDRTDKITDRLLTVLDTHEKRSLEQQRAFFNQLDKFNDGMIAIATSQEDAKEAVLTSNEDLKETIAALHITIDKLRSDIASSAERPARGKLNNNV